MGKLVLSDKEFIGLIIRIITPGEAPTIASWMNYAPDRGTSATRSEFEAFFYKDLGFRDYRLLIPRFFHNGSDVLVADLQLSVKSRSFFNGENHKVVTMIIDLLRQRYIGMEPAVSIANGHLIYHFGNDRDITDDPSDFDGLGSESMIYYEPKSSGMTEKHLTETRNDFIGFRFRRKYTCV